MAEVMDRREAGDEGAIATEIPSKHLPGIPYRDLPEPVPLRKIIGPGVIILAAAIGSGEYVLWPFITSQVGLIAMWLAVVGVATQFFINMEIERYTLATGETAVTGFRRLWNPWGWIMVAAAFFSWGWPGWATGASTALTFVFPGIGEDNVAYVTIALLVAIGIALTVSPVVYQLVEKTQIVFVAIIIVFLVVAAFVAIEAGDWADLGAAVGDIGRLPDPEIIGYATLLGALAFAGAGGTLNLVQSNWIRDKGLGMGVHIPRIVSPLTGEEEAAPSTGYFFRQDEDNLRRWRGWWRVANAEHFWTFGLIGALSIILLSLLTYATIFGQAEGLEQNFDFVRLEGEALKEAVAPWFGTFFWLVGVVILLSTNLGVIDHVGRLTADVAKVGMLRDNERITESRVYVTIVWAMVIFGSIILLSGVTQPVLLLVISSSINGVIMFVYSGLLWWLNGRVLPRTIRMSPLRIVMMTWAVLFFGFFSVILVYDQITRQLLGG
jgi:hypothetical protein